MASINSYMAHLKPWYDSHVMPAVDELYREDEAASYRQLASARAALHGSSELNAEERQALAYELLLFEHLIVNRFHDDAAQAAQFARTYPAIRDWQPLGPLASTFRAACLLCLLGLGARRGYIRMTEAEVDALVAAIPAEQFPSNLWYYLIVWAFLNDNLKYLEQALGELTVGATGWVDDYYWLRTNLMYQLVSGKATRLDLEKTIRGYEHPHHIQDFRNLFLQRSEQAGLMDAGLYRLLEEREAELQLRRGTIPGTRPRTGRMLRRA